MSRHTRRSLSLPARMAAAGVDRVFVAEATTLALGYGSQRLTNSRLWSDNMVLRTRADLSDALLREAADVLGGVMTACDQGRMVAKTGVGGMTIEANIRGSVYMGVPAWPIEIARATLDKMRAHLDGETE